MHPDSPVPVISARQRVTLLPAAALAAVLGAHAGGTRLASARGSTPAAEGGLLSMGYPTLVVTGTDDGIADPGEVAAGLTLVGFDNQGSSDAALELYAVGDQAGYDALVELFASVDTQAMMPPPEFYELTIAGGVAAPAGEMTHVLVDLPAGTWAFNYYVASAEDGASANVLTKVEVTGEPNDMTPPEADVVAGMVEMAFEMPDEIAAGPLVWEVANDGMQPHFILLSKYPEPFTDDDVMELLMSFDPSSGAPATPTALDFGLFEDVFESPVMSSGLKNGYDIDLEAGYYVALCFIPDPETGMPHALMGMYKVFTVS